MNLFVLAALGNDLNVADDVLIELVQLVYPTRFVFRKTNAPIRALTSTDASLRKGAAIESLTSTELLRSWQKPAHRIVCPVQAFKHFRSGIHTPVVALTNH